MKRQALGVMLALAVAAPQIASAKGRSGGGSRAACVSSKGFPARASSEAAARAGAKKASSKEIGPMDPEATKGWEYRFNMMVFFAKAMSDNTVTVNVYDITEGQMRRINTFDQFLSP